MISFIVAPPGAEQLSPLTTNGIQHPLAGEVLNAMRQHGSTPVGLWKFINKLACAKRPDYRARHRCWRLRYWGAIRELCRARLLFRHSNLIATHDFAYRPKRRRPKLVSVSVGSLNSKMTGSNAIGPAVENNANLKQPLGTDLVSSNPAAIDCAPKTQSAGPTPRAVSAAASLLAMRPRSRKKRWTGILDGQRLRRRTLVKVPNGDVLPVFAVQRGKVFVIPPENSDRVLDRFDATEVQRIENPAALLLGGLKRGKRERHSALKAATARANGLMPCRPGRKRGRPRKTIGPTFPLLPTELLSADLKT